MANIGIVIPAAGQGKRMGAGYNKQFLTLMGRPILAHTVGLFEESNAVSEIVIVGAEGDLSVIEELVHSQRFNKIVAICKGGVFRQDSVRAGVRALSTTIQRIVVHDGARPLLTLQAFHKFIDETQEYPAAIMGVAVKDTIKKIDIAGNVLETLPRELLRAVQTPQIFDRGILEDAHDRAASAGYYGTDDASLLEWMGHPVQMVEGMQENIKVTTPEDLWLAERILATRET
ncbi:2-C-methyl-D-erythritol 4-phosphate cytidylyltransferase [Desulfosporosinus sp.]|uniref:2-C-methyl-D-erythritol 4-phosphate cytidylyltransferase n=1 Tax=Desulfosporosinus sp. TaxID=157907 RepID=UPI000E7D30AC|nr:2-C-methyl-D-erythritol 4-phosphate cytidylyltransferase [Desulfosporosinus sp.]MBC2721310.1 2-C-methyl-D-erythritol 4-phosphate cytidylyltransferase [Desulfosporosinus sp.]MBC2728742.1 2-C-methyl-D-erythritol 4-phosphate cytidylyltransferase [Desulfosporosinus sp.]HBV87692.1 2-C-methyl-D-erythritol 4-phosphate cytidylyltransferase [Desulfosporosinus sp.]